MRKSLVLSTVVLAVTLAFGASAQNREGWVGSEPGKVGMARTATVTGTIKAVDPATRGVTLVGPQGREVTLVAGPEVKNFDRLKAGDQVDIQYGEALLVELKKGGGSPVARTEEGGMTRAAPGAAPGAAAGRVVTIVGDVVDVDQASHRVTVRGPQRTVDLNVADPEQFKLISKGDQLQATYVEAVAIDVSPAKTK